MIMNQQNLFSILIHCAKFFCESFTSMNAIFCLLIRNPCNFLSCLKANRIYFFCF